MFANKSTITLYSPFGLPSEFKVQSLIGQSKFEVYKVSNSKNEIFAMKVFSKDCKEFEEEARFHILSDRFLAAPLLYGSGEYTDYSLEGELTNSEFSYILTSYCPNGTLYDLLIHREFIPDEKTLRTLFVQLVEGLEYMHKLKTAHADIKLENIFIDGDFNIKIADFDLSYMDGDKQLSRGTPDYRAIEVNNSEVYDPYASDIFTLGVLLFVLHNGFMMPFSESQPQSLFDFYFNNTRYWQEMMKMMKLDEDIWSKEFKELFIGMTKMVPSERYSFEKIRESDWYNGEIYTEEELRNVMKVAFEHDKKQI